MLRIVGRLKTSTGLYRSCAAVLHITNLLGLFRTGLVKFGLGRFSFDQFRLDFTNTKKREIKKENAMKYRVAAQLKITERNY